MTEQNRYEFSVDIVAKVSSHELIVRVGFAWRVEKNIEILTLAVVNVLNTPQWHEA